MRSETTVLLFLGDEGPGEVERWLGGGRAAAALDIVHRVMGLPGVSHIVLATPDQAFAERHRDLPVVWDFDTPGEPFHFGRRFAALMEKYPAHVYVYLGAGSLPLLPREMLAQAMDEVARAQTPLAFTNNLYSSDWMVLNCPQPVQRLPQRLERDNQLGWVLKYEAGVEVSSLAASAATRMDIDTPADLLLLGLHPRVGPEAAAYLRAHPQDHSRWLAAGRKLFTPGSRVALVGRVASAAWSHVEAHTQVWARVFSEERGMAASGRQAAGQVRSLIGDYLARLGAAAFFAELAQMVDVVFFDTRVVLAHHHLWPSAADRYASDLGLAYEIRNAFLRELTAAAMQAPMPVVLGGHGVVAGDLYALVELAQAGGLEGA